MNESLYSYSLCLALPLMLFFGLNMLLARVPDKKIFSTFLLSRRLMGVALLVLSANYSVHFFCAPRLKDVDAAIMMNLCTYYLCYWLFSSAMMTLLNNRYLSRLRFMLHLAVWLIYTTFAAAVVIWAPNGEARHYGIVMLAVWLIIYGAFLSFRLLRAYAHAVKKFRDTHSDDIGIYIRWMSIFTIWAIVFGVSCGALTFLPDKYVFIWVLSAIPFYVYLYCCYQNYALSYETVENAIQEENELEESEQIQASASGEPKADGMPAYHSDITKRIKEWIDREGFCKQGITLKELSELLFTNRTYLSEYINTTYHVSFRDWITDLRIDYAKRRMKEFPQQKILEIAEASGFMSLSHFSKTFSEKEGCSPARWRNSIGD